MHNAFLLTLIILTIVNCNNGIQAKKIYSLSLYKAPKYNMNFSHFNYVNPTAPQGGKIIIGLIGTFNTLNPYTIKGIPAAGLNVFGMTLVFESLMKLADDESLSTYPYIAKSIELAKDKSWIIFYINPKAKWSDGNPLTSTDVKFTYELLKKQGHPHLRLTRRNIHSCKILNNLTVKFTFIPQYKKSGKKFFNPKTPLIIGTNLILPKHVLETYDFNDSLQKYIPGSGPYKIKSLKFGKSITFEKRQNYWGKNLPIMKGMYNFQEIKFDYYRDKQIALEAFKSGEYDFQIITNPNQWKIAFNFLSVKKEKIKKIEFFHKRPIGMCAFVMNTRKKKFSNRKVRKAILHAFANLDNVNKILYSKELKRTSSFFENTELSAQTKISNLEKLLAKILSINILNEIIFLPKISKNVNIRKHLLKSKNLLEESGWTINNNKLLDKNGKQFTIEVLLVNKEYKKILLSFSQNLKILGIKLKIKTSNTSQYWNKISKFNFDSIITYWPGINVPGKEQYLRWSTQSSYVNGSVNYSGVKNCKINKIIRYMNNTQKKENYIIAIHILDRLLLEGYYVIPLFHDAKHRIAYWESLEHPKINPKIGLGIQSWWSKSVN